MVHLMRSFIMASSMAIVATPVLAQDPSQPTVAIIKQGHPAPFDGVLYDDASYAQERTRQEQQQQRFDDQLQLQLLLQRTHLQLATSTTANALSAAQRMCREVDAIKDKRISGLEDELARAAGSHPGVWEDVRPFVYAAAIIVAVIGASVAVKDLRDAFRD